VLFLEFTSCHVFQALRVPARFKKANAVYSSGKNYPLENEVFKEDWNTEGSILSAALREKDESKRLGLIQ
jgi:hypothetical protein